MQYDPFKNWQSWKGHYRDQLQHPVGFEEVFVDKVLSQIPQITPSDVIPQYHFTDDAGKDRFIDFVILNRNKGYFLAIELDGLTKLQDGMGNLDYHRYQDMWVRQNALMGTGAVLLRFTNKDMLYKTAWVSEQITKRLNEQYQNHHAQQEQLADYVKQIHELKTRAASSQAIQEAIKELQIQIRAIQAVQEQTQLAVSGAIKTNSDHTKEAEQTAEPIAKPVPTMVAIPSREEIHRQQQQQFTLKQLKHKQTDSTATTKTVQPKRSKAWVWGVLCVGLMVTGVWWMTDYATDYAVSKPVSKYPPHEPEIQSYYGTTDMGDGTPAKAEAKLLSITEPALVQELSIQPHKSDTPTVSSHAQAPRMSNNYDEAMKRMLARYDSIQGELQARQKSLGMQTTSQRQAGLANEAATRKAAEDAYYQQVLNNISNEVQITPRHPIDDTPNEERQNREVWEQ